jgi:hypothetical protein
MTDNYHKNQEYFTRSYLVAFLKSPLHAKTLLESEEKSTPALLFGQAYHAMLAGTFSNDFTILDEAARPEPEKTMASTLNKMWRSELESQGKPLISADDHRTMLEMNDMMANNEFVRRMNAFEYRQEVAICAEIDGYKVKCKPDVIIRERSLLVDWKTTTELPVNAYQAERLVRKYNYHFQAAMYCDITGMDHFLFFFQEKSAPYDVVPVLISKVSPLMEEGRDLWRYCAKLATECQQKNKWGGVASTITDNCITL